MLKALLVGSYSLLDSLLQCMFLVVPFDQFECHLWVTVKMPPARNLMWSSVPALGTLRHISNTWMSVCPHLLFQWSFSVSTFVFKFLFNFFPISFSHLNWIFAPIPLYDAHSARWGSLPDTTFPHSSHISCSSPSHSADIVLSLLFPVPHRNSYLLVLCVKGRYCTVCFCTTKRQNGHDSFPEWKLRLKAPVELKLATLYFPPTEKK